MNTWMALVMVSLLSAFGAGACAGNGGRPRPPTVDCEDPQVLHDKEFALWRSLLDAVQGLYADCKMPARAIEEWTRANRERLELVREATANCPVKDSDELLGARMRVILVSGTSCGEATPVFWAAKELRKALGLERVPIRDRQ